MGRNNADFNQQMVPIDDVGGYYSEHGTELRNVTEKDVSKTDRGAKYDWDALHADIQKHGVTTPLEVHVDHFDPQNPEYSVMNGVHRYIAAKNLGLTHVPVTYKHVHWNADGTVVR